MTVTRTSTTTTPRTRRTTPTSAPTAATTATATTATTTNSAAPTARGAVQVPLTAVNGFAGKSWSATYSVPAAGQNQASYVGVAGVKRQDGYTRGKIEVESKPVDDKSFAVTVKTMHSGAYLKGGDDKMTLMLQARVQDGAKEAIVNLGLLKDGEALNNKGRWNGEHTFRFSYDDINTYLRSLSPNLKLVGGAKLAVAARWAGGHEWGGFGRKGDFEVPMPQRTSPLSTRIGGAGGAAAVKPQKSAGGAAALPLDIAYDMPAALAKQTPAFFGKKVEVSSRLETELKGRLKNDGENEAALVRLYMLTQDPKALEAAIGKGFTLTPHTEWWTKDKKGQFTPSARLKAYTDPDAVKKAGLAKTAAEAKKIAAAFAAIPTGEPLPLEDLYASTKGELAASVVSRIRSNAIAEGLHNLKPGPGVLLADIDKAHKNQPSGLLRKRIEYGLTLKDKRVPRDELEAWLKKTDSPYNPAGAALRELLPSGTPDKTPISFKMTQERHRFTLEHKDGLSIDISVDFVTVTHKGKKVTMPMVEMEIDHLYFGQGNKGGAKATSIRGFNTESEQKTWARTLSGGATLNGLPRFHELSDLQDKSIWETKEQKQTEKVIDALFPLLYPNGAAAAPQKGVACAQDLGLL